MPPSLSILVICINAQNRLYLDLRTWNEGWALNCGLFCGFLIGPWSQPPYWDIRLSSYFCSLSVLLISFWMYIFVMNRLTKKTEVRKFMTLCLFFGTPAFWALRDKGNIQSEGCSWEIPMFFLCIYQIFQVFLCSAI